MKRIIASERPETPDFIRDGGMVPASSYRMNEKGIDQANQEYEATKEEV